MGFGVSTLAKNVLTSIMKRMLVDNVGKICILEQITDCAIIINYIDNYMDISIYIMVHYAVILSETMVLYGVLRYLSKLSMTV